MNPNYYDEHRPRHRRCAQHYRRTLAVGAAPLLISLWLGTAYFPRIGPGLYANAGLSLAGLLLVWSVREMQMRPPVSRWGRWIAIRMDDLFPALLIGLQGWFVMLTALLIWNTIAELGFPTSRMNAISLMGILLLSPVRRIMAGTSPQNPSPLRGLLAEALGYLNAILITLFIAGFLTELSAQETGPREEPPLEIILIWVFATLVMLTCVVLFLDYIIRKMPPKPQEEEIDTLD